MKNTLETHTNSTPSSIPQQSRRPSAPAGIFLASALLITGCAGPKYAITPVPGQGQSTRMDQGRTVVESSRKNLVMASAVDDVVRKKQRLRFLVTTGNRGEQPFDFSYDNINLLRNGETVRLVSYENRKKEIETAAAWAAVAAGLNAASASMRAAMPQTTYTTLHGPGGSANVALTTYNPTAAAIQQQQINANMNMQMNQIMDSSSAQLNALSAVLRPTTIKPGGAAGGVVICEGFKSGDNHELVLEVSLPDEKHEFRFLIKKEGK